MIRNSVDAKSGYFFIQWRHKIEPSSLLWIFKMVPSAMLSFLYFLDFSFKSYNVCAVRPSYDYCTVLLCQTAARHFGASSAAYDPGFFRLHELDAVNK